LTLLSCNEAGIPIPDSTFTVGSISRGLAVLPSIEFSGASGFAFWLFWWKCPTWAPSIPVFLLSASAVQGSGPSVSPIIVSLLGGIFLFEDAISEVETVIFLIRLIWAGGSFSEVKRAFTSYAG
jgi:hypothetical protein